ncbi:MAG: hypothetical protein HWE39_05155 [Oceanospirillaceae bacterium]|nr:hypothetical protein [Oceanospirillaceae bacterium]
MESNNNKGIEQISLLKVMNDLLLHRKLVVLFCIIFFILGTIISLLSPKYWTTNLTLLPEEASTSLGGSSLGGLASIAGFNLSGASSGSISPDVYPTILSSTPFLMFLYESEVRVDKIPGQMTLGVFLNRHHRSYSFSVKSWLSSLFSGERGGTHASADSSEILELTEKEFNALRKIQSSIDVVVERKTGLVKISAEFQDPSVSAEVALLTTYYIQNYISDYHTTRERRNLTFLEKQLEVKRRLYNNSLQKLAEFKDSNIGPLTNRADIELKNLENEFDLAFNIYSTVNKQLEEAKLVLEDESISFQVIEPVKKPIIKSKPKRLSMIILFTFLGFVFSAFAIQIRSNFKSIDSV